MTLSESRPGHPQSEHDEQQAEQGGVEGGEGGAWVLFRRRVRQQRLHRHITRRMEPLALYIHWPFCAAKCPYCDFNSHVRDSIDQARWRAALRRELAHEAARAKRRPPPPASIFFGGGTPSLMDPATAAALIADARTLFDAAPDLEITLEANPTSVEAARLAEIREAGVNRLSLGVQALDGEALRFLGRKHDAAQAMAALELGRALFPRCPST